MKLHNEKSYIRDRIPKEHLLNQLYMFSSTFDIQEAFENIMLCNSVMINEELEKGIDKLQRDLGIYLPYLHKRKSDYDFKISDNDYKFLQEKLGKEYKLYKMIREKLA